MSAAELLLLASLAGVAYAYVGYPLLIALRARIAPKPLRPHARATMPHVSVVVIAHDAARWLPAKLASLDALDYPPERLEFVVASDGSIDATAQILREAREPRLKALVFPSRRGKSACLGDAIATATGEIVVFTDVRQALDPGAVAALVAALADPAVGAASGELVFRERHDEGASYAASVGAYWRYEKWLRRNESRSGSVVGATGALYAVRRALLPRIPSGVVLDDVYIPMAVALQRARVVFVPEAIAWDEPSSDAASEARRKRRTLAGNYQLVALRPILLDPFRNPLWLRFVSHKLMRLAAPWLLLAAFLSNLALAGEPGYGYLFAAQCAGYALAFAGMRSARLRKLAPVRLAATFVEMNLCAALALFDWLSGRDLHLWRPGRAVQGAAP